MAKKYAAVQILRFVAATFVVIDHAISNVIDHWTHAPWLDSLAWSLGDLGVIVFFGISGFIMASTQYESFGGVDRSVSFFWRRILRIVPIYTVATTIEYLHRMHLGGAYTFENYLKSLAFIPYIGDGDLYQPILGQGWTLNYEMFFYLVFALSLCMKRSVGFLISIGGFTVLALLQGIITVPYESVAAFYVHHILLYFVCGMLVALIRKRLDATSQRILLPVLFVTMVMAVTTLLHVMVRDSYFLPIGLIAVFLCVFVCAGSMPPRVTKVQLFFERLGDASYSTYLFHGFCLGGIKFISNAIGQGQYLLMVAFVLGCMVLANLTGWVAFRFVEQPISRLTHRRSRVLVGQTASS